MCRLWICAGHRTARCDQKRARDDRSSAAKDCRRFVMATLILYTHDTGRHNRSTDSNTFPIRKEESTSLPGTSCPGHAAPPTRACRPPAQSHSSSAQTVNRTGQHQIWFRIMRTKSAAVKRRSLSLALSYPDENHHADQRRSPCRMVIFSEHPQLGTHQFLVRGEVVRLDVVHVGRLLDS